VFVAEKGGRVLTAAPGDPRPRLLVDLGPRANSFADRGLLGLALDADFATPGSPYAGRIYLLYVHDPKGTDQDYPTHSRLTHITVDEEGELARDDAGEMAEEVVMDGIPAEDRWHLVGTVRSDPRDGTLWIGTGDATAEQHRRALEALDEHYLRGKILHVDREGRGLAGNPFCPHQTGSNCSKVFAAGFRNPFRFQLREDGGLVVGDVGYNQYEEVSLVRAGENHGWPCYEGTVQNSRAFFRDLCGDWYAPAASSSLAWPAFSYPNAGNAAVIAGPEYSGTGFPAGYRGSIFFGDYAQGWIRYRQPTGEIREFATGWRGVQLDPDASGNDLVSVTFGGGSLGSGSVWRITYSPGDRAPVARATASRAAGPPPLSVRLAGGQSQDPEGDPITYEWDFEDDGEVDIAGPEHAEVDHTYGEPGRYTPRLTVRDPNGNFGSTRVLVVAGNAPKLQLSGDTTFRPGQPVAVDASASDAEDGRLGPSAFKWEVTLQHNDHFHDYTRGTGPAIRFTADSEHAEDGVYEVHVTATDSHGLTDTQVRRVTYRTDPAEGPGTDPAPPTVPGPGPVTQRDRTKPRLTLKVKGRKLWGQARDPSKPVRVKVSLRRNCRSRDGRRLRPRNCSKRIWLKARLKGTRWAWTARRSLPRGTYAVRVRATDAAGNRRVVRGQLRRR
jgi:glucose/arabinose dehydrogenase